MLIGGSGNGVPFYQTAPTSYTTLTPDMVAYGGASSYASGGGGYFTGIGSGLPFDPFGGALAVQQPQNIYTTSYTDVGLSSLYSPYTYVPPVQPVTVSAPVVTAPAPVSTPISAPAPVMSTPAATGGGSTASEAKRKAAAQEPKAQTQKKPVKTVTVKAGDSLSKIADAHNTTWQKLYALNKDAVGSDPRVIHVGLKLKLPS